MYQNTQIIGNVGIDPEMRYTQTGKAVTSFTVAVNESWTNAAGQKQEETTWFRVSCWEKLAEITGQYVKKGMQVFVTGKIKAQAFTDKQGELRASLELTAKEVKFLGSRAENGPSATAAPVQEETSAEIPF